MQARTYSAPELILERYFAEPRVGAGVMQSIWGTLQRQFVLSTSGVWSEADRTLTLTERYQFDDGSVDTLAWRIVKQADGRYTGEEPRMVGAATGTQSGNAFHWIYRRTPAGARVALDFDDWFWLQPGGLLIARASMGRLGLPFGTMTVVYRAAVEAEAGARQPVTPDAAL
jgi:hypothetical protein